MKQYKSIFDPSNNQKFEFKSKPPKVDLKELQKRRDPFHKKLMKILEEIN